MNQSAYEAVIKPVSPASTREQPVDSVEYILDANDCIVEVGGDWTTWCQENHAMLLSRSHITGQPIWNYVIGEETRDVYEQLLKHVRESGESVTFAYRCDSPDCRRYTRMIIQPAVDREPGTVHFISQTLRETPILRSHVCTAKLYTGMLQRCSLCTRLVLDGQWVEMAHAVEQGLLDRDEKLIYMYTVCSDCRDRLRQLVKHREDSLA